MHHHRPQLPSPARVLATSFFRHHPAGRLSVLVLDDPFGELDVARSHSRCCISPTWISSCPNSTPWRLCTPSRSSPRPSSRGSCTPFCAGETPSVLYLDPDIQVFHPLDELTHLAEEHGIVLTPHVTAPMPHDQR